jgi:hypothetical protein
VDLVLEQRDDGVRPVADVVRRLLVADRDEPAGQGLELVVAQPVDGVGRVVGDGSARVGLDLARPGERDEPRVGGECLRKLLEELVDAAVPLW